MVAVSLKKKENEEMKALKPKENSGSKLPIVIIVGIILLIVIGLFLKGSSSVPSLTYMNPVHGYSYEYPHNMQLVAVGNIPEDLKAQGVSSMEQLNLTNGDSILVRTNETSGDNIVYTILELSTRPNFDTFDLYLTSLLASLDESKEITGTEYLVSDSEVGDNIVSTEYSFEMEVPVDEEGNTRTGVFYDNVFQTENGRAYSISFGYPKDIGNASEYIDIYRDILASFKIGGEITEVSDVLDVTEEVSDNIEIEVELDDTSDIEDEVVE